MAARAPGAIWAIGSVVFTSPPLSIFKPIAIAASRPGVAVGQQTVAGVAVNPIHADPAVVAGVFCRAIVDIFIARLSGESGVGAIAGERAFAVHTNPGVTGINSGAIIFGYVTVFTHEPGVGAIASETVGGIHAEPSVFTRVFFRTVIDGLIAKGPSEPGIDAITGESIGFV